MGGRPGLIFPQSSGCSRGSGGGSQLAFPQHPCSAEAVRNSVTEKIREAEENCIAQELLREGIVGKRNNECKKE